MQEYETPIVVNLSESNSGCIMGSRQYSGCMPGDYQSYNDDGQSACMPGYRPEQE